MKKCLPNYFGNHFAVEGNQVINYRHRASLELFLANFWLAECLLHLRMQNYRHPVYRPKAARDYLGNFYRLWPENKSLGNSAGADCTYENDLAFLSKSPIGPPDPESQKTPKPDKPKCQNSQLFAGIFKSNRHYPKVNLISPKVNHKFPQSKPQMFLGNFVKIVGFQNFVWGAHGRRGFENIYCETIIFAQNYEFYA